ncbi:conjugative transposon protein TraN [Pedobacter chitinilyticus]|uniref:Conjugative transposon protein TraN n=1 Tax=Pedobacter chitinilyticus TaxID=2233776 RepID=A0A443YVY4_9SPHI|nr:conjugative transposon protein TraN [Pedobacter chitinilyticus]RWU08126.1 conjugative transposon protein TraN [Pedobacter chitinilyticus]
MKTKTLLIAIALVMTAIQGWAQQATFQTDSKSRLEPLPLGISLQKTTNLIFPFAIRSVDRGSSEVLVQKAKGVENVLQLKAAKDSFQQTNLSVITADGSLYSFMLNFSAQPTSLNLQLADKPMGYEPLAIFAAAKDNQEKILTASEFVSVKNRSLSGPSSSRSGIQLQLLGMFIREGVLYFQLQLANNSKIPYDIDQLRFFIIDQKKSKRTASQELEQSPLHIHGNTTVVHTASKQVIVVALEKFTIPDKKNLVIQLNEKNGGRHLQLKVANRHLERSISF